jgi:hypothetical protein
MGIDSPARLTICIPSTMLGIIKPTAFPLLAAGAMMSVLPAIAPAAPAGITGFLQKHCAKCHDAATKEGGLDLTALKFEPAESVNFSTWVLVHDRVSKGEMPPKGARRPPAEELDGFRKELSSSLVAADRARVATEGRSTRRRMNRAEYENTLRDLFSIPNLEVKDFLPEDNEAYGFNKVGDALDVSHVQVARYLSASEFAVRSAMAPQAAPFEKSNDMYYTWDQPAFSQNALPIIRQTFRLLDYAVQPRGRFGTRGLGPVQPPGDPAKREKESVVIVNSTYEPTEIRFNRFRAPVTGRYKLTFSAFAMWMSLDFTKAGPGHRPEPVTVYSDRSPSLFRRLGGFDVGVEPTVAELDTWLIAGETIRPDANRFVRCRPPDLRNPLSEKDGMPGLAFQWMKVEGPLFDEWPPPGHKVLFGDLPIVDRPRREPTGRRGGTQTSGVDVVSKNPEADAESLLRRFMARVYRGPVQEVDVQRFLKVIRGALKAGHSFTDSMVAGYTAVLSSPAFLYFDEKPGRLSGRALADRLAYFLWNSPPDEELLRLAAAGELPKPDVLRRQTDRLLDDRRSRRFVDAFLDYWLDLRHIEATSPDTLLYPDYELDDHLTESLLDETRLYFADLLRRDLAASHLIASDYTFLNERLAAHYGVPGVTGIALRPVTLPPDSVRGGLLTQGSILKVTANGTTTSPVTRGVWVMSRLLGLPPKPPPASVPAVDPDIRGATTIREQLAKHRSDATCNACHQHIDPAGLALENFDVMGAWRDRYRSVGEGDATTGIGHNGQRYRYKLGPPVDAAGTLADGREFCNVRELKQCLLRDTEQVARNLLQQFAVYATGAPIRFSDRPAIEAVLARTKPEGYRVRSLVHEIVQSDLFLNK